MTSGRTPLVSVVMPAFNVARFIADAVRSVLTQSLTDLELIIVDDGSTDGTLDRLEPFDDPRLRVVAQANAGSSAARNAGLRDASGYYVAFLDADDWWRRDKLQRHVDVLDAHPDVDLTFSRSQIVDEGGRATGRTSRRVSGRVSFRQLLIENVVNNGSAVVMRRDALRRVGRFDTALRACVDLDLWLRVARLRPHNCLCLDEVLTVYRMRQGQITKDWRRMEEAWLTVFARMRAIAAADADAVSPQAHANLYRYLAYIAYESDDHDSARRCLLRAFRHSAMTTASDSRTWVLLAAVLGRVALPHRYTAPASPGPGGFVLVGGQRTRACNGAAMKTVRLALLLVLMHGAADACRGRAVASSRTGMTAVSERLLDGFKADAPPAEQDYEQLFQYFVEGFEAHRSAAGALTTYDGLPSRHGRRADAFEGFSRSAPLWGAWVSSGRPASVRLSDGADVDLIDTFRQGLLAGTDPAGDEYWGDVADLDQRIVEASDVALSVWLFRDSVWGGLSATEKAQVVQWLRQSENRRVPDSNWHLFPVFINAVLRSLHVEAATVASRAHYARFKTFYRGDGWFSDGPADAFDYYNAWGIHYQLYWLDLVDPAWDHAFIAKTRTAFLATYPYLMGPSGFPILGRSVCYRMAAAAPLVFGQATNPDEISPVDARRAIDSVWRFFIRQGALEDGNVSQGYCGPDPRILDNYSGPASCLWALRSLIVAFALPSDAPLWRSPAGSLPVERHDVFGTDPGRPLDRDRESRDGRHHGVHSTTGLR